MLASHFTNCSTMMRGYFCQWETLPSFKNLSSAFLGYWSDFLDYESVRDDSYVQWYFRFSKAEVMSMVLLAFGCYLLRTWIYENVVKVSSKDISNCKFRHRVILTCDWCFSEISQKSRSWWHVHSATRRKSLESLPSYFTHWSRLVHSSIRDQVLGTDSTVVVVWW